MKRLKTSLIIPAFNESQYLPSLFASIRTSSVQPDEILLCDNNSTDNTVDMAKKYGANLPLQILYEKRQGIVPTVENLWRNATGNIILKVDADSIIPTRWIEHTVNHFRNDSTLSGCTGPVFSSDGAWYHRLLVTIGYLAGAPIYRLWKRNILLYGPNSAFRTSALKKINGYVFQSLGLDDQIISKKLSTSGFKTRWFIDMYIYHSTRRYHSNPRGYLNVLLSIINPKYYKTKS